MTQTIDKTLARRPEDWKFAPQPLEGKKIVLSGGTTGIGRAILLMLTAEGADVLTFARGKTELDEALAAADGAAGKAYGLTADQSRPDDLKAVFARVDRDLGGLDILINCAAVAGGSVTDSGFEETQSVLHTNIDGYVQCCRLALERMKDNQGHIVNIGSMSAHVRESGSDIYAATKAAVMAFSDSLRKTLNKKGIRVSLIEPGSVGSDMQPTSPQEEAQRQKRGEMLVADDIAEAVHYCLTQPSRCEIMTLQIKPTRQII
ncbi:MAG: SDR family oxidoreductase [Planctomycetaceae bacterium]|nr:SDR family oxidoreductase [Planctomycetaceae bacterium]